MIPKINLQSVLKLTTKNNENLHNLICLFFLFSVVTHGFIFFDFSSFSWNSYICTTLSNKILPERLVTSSNLKSCWILDCKFQCSVRIRGNENPQNTYSMAFLLKMDGGNPLIQFHFIFFIQKISIERNDNFF